MAKSHLPSLLYDLLQYAGLDNLRRVVDVQVNFFSHLAALYETCSLSNHNSAHTYRPVNFYRSLIGEMSLVDFS